MIKDEIKYIKTAIFALQTKRNEYRAYHSVEKPVFDFEINAQKHWKEYTDAIEYFENLLEESKI